MPEKVNADKPKFIWTEERAEKFKSLLPYNLTYRQLAQQMGGGCRHHHVETALKWLRSGQDIKIGPRCRGFTKEEDQELVRLFVEEELSMIEISRRIGRHRDVVRRRLDALGQYSKEISVRRGRSDIVQRARVQKSCENRRLAQSWKQPLRALWTARSDRARAKLYNGCRYEDANVPKIVPRCGRLG